MKVKGKTKKLEEVCSFVRGVVFSKDEEIETTDGFGILRSHNVDFENFRVSFEDMKFISPKAKVKDEQRLLKNDILISVANSKEQTGKVGFSYTDTDFYAGGFMAIMRPLNGINPYYLFANLSTHNFKQFIEGKNQGTTSIWNITFNRIKDYEFVVPDKEKQNQLAELFQSIETSIEESEQQKSYLLKLKNQLLTELTGEKMQFGNFLKAKDFEKVKFEKIAFSISERVEPKKTDLKTYVGLEHLDADNLKIERTGTPDHVIGTKLKIYKGDIIFGKRRAYLRKVAVSHFDGIASAHSMILRANEKQIEKSFLPHFLQSDVFMQRAVQISEGSLSPTIKWKTLAAQEFILPKKEKQNQLTEVFDQIDKTRDELKIQKQTLKNLKQKLLNEILG